MARSDWDMQIKTFSFLLWENLRNYPCISRYIVICLEILRSKAWVKSSREPSVNVLKSVNNPHCKLPTETLSRWSAAQLNVSALQFSVQFSDLISLAEALPGSAYCCPWVFICAPASDVARAWPCRVSSCTGILDVGGRKEWICVVHPRSWRL